LELPLKNDSPPHLKSCRAADKRSQGGGAIRSAKMSKSSTGGTKFLIKISRVHG
jgi:hypothetical protein